MQPTLRYVTLLSSGVQRSASKPTADRSLDLLFDEMVQEAVEDGLSQDLTRKLDRIANGFKSGRLTLPQALDDAYQALRDGVDDDAQSLDESSDEAGDDLLLGSAGVLGALGAIAQQGAAEGKLDNHELEGALSTGYQGAAQTSVAVASARWAGRTDVASMRQTLIDRIARQVHGEGSKILDRVRDGSTSLAQGQAQFRTALHNAVWYNEASAANDFARSAGMSFAWWETDSPVGKEYPCDDCSVREEESPYSLDELPGLPGDGTTQCGPGCLCTVRYSNSDVERQLRRLYRRARYQRVERHFNPDEERDERGRWTASGDSGETSGKDQLGPWTGAPKSADTRLKSYGEGDKWFEEHYGTNQATMEQRCVDYVNELQTTNPAAYEEGREWYATAHDYGNLLAEKYGVSPERAYAVIAALAPQTEWELNARMADQLLAISTNRVGQTIALSQDDLAYKNMVKVTDENGKAVKGADGKPVYETRFAHLEDRLGHPLEFKPSADAHGRTLTDAAGRPLMLVDAHDLSPHGQAAINPDLRSMPVARFDTAFKLARGANVNTTLGGTKVRSFFNNIEDGGAHSYVTVDTHQFRAMVNDKDIKVNGDQVQAAIFKSPMRYEVMADAIRHAAPRLNMTPAQVQATMWTGWRMEHPDATVGTSKTPNSPNWHEPPPPTSVRQQVADYRRRLK